MLTFSVGKLFAVPPSTATDLTPVCFATLQDVSIGFSWDQKELYGGKQFAEAVARGKGKVDIKAGFARIKAAAFNQVFNGTITAGMKKMQTDGITSAVTVPASSGPYTVTVTPPSSGTFSANYEVLDVSNSSIALPMSVVSSGPSTGQYTVNASGTYTFSSADAGKAVQITYEYSVTTGKTIAVTNQPMGAAPTFSGRFYNEYTDKGVSGQFGYKFYQLISTKLDTNTKIDDFTIPNIDFLAQADASGKVFDAYVENEGS